MNDCVQSCESAGVIGQVKSDWETFFILPLPDLSRLSSTFPYGLRSAILSKLEVERHVLAPGGASMLTLRLSSSSSETEFYLNCGWLLNQTLTFFFPRTSNARTTKSTRFSSLLATVFALCFKSRIHCAFAGGEE